MRRARRAMIVALAVVVGCRDEMHAPAASPAALTVVTDLPASGTAGASAGTFAVLVTDASDQPVVNTLVQFAPAIGAVRAEPARVITGADGIAATSVTLSTTPGPNQVTALVAGVGQVRSATTSGAPGQARFMALAPRVLWFQPADQRRAVSAVARDASGNALPPAIEWASRDPALVSVAPTSAGSAELSVVGRPGKTYLVASQDGAVDSILVAVHDSSSSPCDFLTTAVDLGVGGALAFEQRGMTCVRAPASAEYFVVAHYNTPVALANAGIGLVAHGVVDQTSAGGANARALSVVDVGSSFETALRDRERARLPAFVPAARAWYDTRPRMASLSAVLRVGDVLPVNVNAFDFCADPAMHGARVAALTPATAILEDTSNPEGGFSDEEYQSIAATVDTLVAPVNVAAFGAPTDIDGNGRIAILFTRAVNELTPRGAGSIVLGFFYARDLLPRSGAPGGACPGSNAGEIFYVMVPDPAGVTSDARTKAFVHDVTVSTIAHELQHLISASRRLYVTRAQESSEETWLNEGLSHIAEELVFYRASGLSPRQNIGAGALAAGTPAREMHDLFMRGNFGRLQQFLSTPAVNSPLAATDQLATRGATWAYLRYVADRAGVTDGDLWRRLVDGRRAGVANLDDALAGTRMTTLGALREWSIALAVDELVGSSNPALAQASWDFGTALPAVGMAGGPEIFQLRNGQASSLPLRAGGTIHYRIAVDAGREALIQVSSGGGVPQPGMRLTVVRTR